MAPSSNDALPELTDAERGRYARHLLLPEIGPAGQRRLKASSVLVVGAGGLGSPALLYLAAAGVGRIGIIDGDTVDETNLQRQTVHGQSDVGRLKVESARDRLREINPHVRVETYPFPLVADDACRIIGGYDLVVNGADNFPARYRVSDACVLTGRPHVHGAIHRFQGEVAVFWPGKGPCYRCLHPTPPAPGEAPSCAEAGVLGVLPGIVGSFQAAQAIQCLLGIGQPLVGRLLLIDTLGAGFHTLTLKRRADCPVCGDHPTRTAVVDDALVCASGRESPTMREITAIELKARRDRGDEFVLVDVREPFELAIAAIDGAISIPLRTLPSRQAELDPDADIVVMCRSGARSADAIAYLQSLGFTNLANLRGGILAWSDTVDPRVAKY